MAESASREYKAKVVEQIGAKKADKIEEELAQDKLDKNPANEKTVVLTGKGQYLCFDSFSSRYFRSDIESIRKIENVFNQRLLREDWLCITQTYIL